MTRKIKEFLHKMDMEFKIHEELKRKYVICQRMKGAVADELIVYAEVKKVFTANSNKTEMVELCVHGEVAAEILKLIEAHIENLGRQSKQRLEILVDELKKVGDGNENFNTKS